MKEINKKELQGLLVRGYTQLPAACYLLLRIENPSAAKGWLAANLQKVTSGDHKPHDHALNIAFSFEGLKRLGLDPPAASTFPYEFQDGMDSPHKQNMLGDFGNSDPLHWGWGGKKNTPIHVLLMLYASNTAALENFYTTLSPGWPTGAIDPATPHWADSGEQPFALVAKLGTKEITARKEHFGFHDGISQPTIKGLGRSEDASENIVAPGEFILGYPNEYGQFTSSPAVSPASDKANMLQPARDNSSLKDLGQHGSFLVFRQLEQDVRKFWDFMEDKTLNADGACNPEAMIRMASKTVGRWPSGTSLELSPDKDKHDLENKNDFNYIPRDKEGLVCPFGAHVRRTNPRNSINRGDSTSVEVSKKHRILRRGRSYGAPLAPSMRPEDIIKVKEDDGERGLYFICLNADLGRQFEFIQNFWINNPKFDGLYDERDPLCGNHSNPQEEQRTGTFGIPQDKIRQRFTDLPEFVTVRGGSYFFLPGIKALHYLAAL